MFEKLKSVASAVVGTTTKLAGDAMDALPQTQVATAALNLAGNLLGDIPEKDRANIHSVCQIISKQISAIRQESNYLYSEIPDAAGHVKRLNDASDVLQGCVNALLLVIRSES